MTQKIKLKKDKDKTQMNKKKISNKQKRLTTVRLTKEDTRSAPQNSLRGSV